MIVFDGECVLCSGFFRVIVKRDKGAKFSFATAQSSIGQELYETMGLPTDDFETNLVIMDGKIHQRLDAACAAVRNFGLIWRLLSLTRFLPPAIKDRLYFLIARNRYRLFGRYETCMVPTEDVKLRFLDGGFNAG